MTTRETFDQEPRAVILAGGKGTRLLPFTTLIPKPLVPVANERAIVEIVIGQLRDCGFRRITLAVNHFARLIQSYLGDGEDYGVLIDYSLETSAAGTMGPLALIDDLPENFLVMNADVLCDLDFGAFLRAHMDNSSQFTIAATQRVVESEFGVLEVQNSFLTNFFEKPTHEHTVSAGIYGMNRDVVSFIPQGRQFGFDDLMLTLLENNIPVAVETWSGSWLDIGRPQDYETAQKMTQ